MSMIHVDENSDGATPAEPLVAGYAAWCWFIVFLIGMVALGSGVAAWRDVLACAGVAR